MAAFRDLSFGRKLIVVILVTCGVSLLLACSAFVAHDFLVYRQTLVDDLAGDAEMIGINTTAALAFDDADAAAQTLQSLRSEQHVVAACIYDRAGKVFARYGREGGPEAGLPSRPENDGIRFRGDFLELFQSIQLDGVPVGTVFIRHEMTMLRTRLLRYVGIAAVVLGVSVLVALLLATPLQRLVSEPILSLARTAETVSTQRNYAVRATRQGNDELGRFVDTFNQMLSRIQEQDAELRRHRERLEEQVAARTAELVEVNAELVLARDRAETANRLKSEFLANTSHELRTPLNAIIGFLQLVLDGMVDNREEEREFLGNALTSSTHLLGLINDVLDIAKIEAGKLDLTLGAVDVEDLLEQVCSLTLTQARQKSLGLACEVVDAPIKLHADISRTKQALLNLLGNSIKFTPTGGIHVRAVAYPDRGMAEITVRDTGIGIPPERQEDVFEKFVQLDGSSTRKHGGTGLGLAITRSLVELMGGRVHLWSAGEGQGTEVTIALPLFTEVLVGEAAAATAPPKADRAPGSGDLSPDKVLVVDDDPAFRAYLTRILESHGYTTCTATTADEAYEAVLRERPGTATIDLAMPAAQGARLRDGWDLIRRLSDDPLGSQVNLVVISAYADEVRSKLALCAVPRLLETLDKPIDPNRLLNALEGLTAQCARRPPHVVLVDDDALERRYIRRILPPSAFECEEIADGAEAYRRLCEGRLCADVLLLDLQMPGASGFDIIRAAKIQRRAPALPIVVLTNDPDSCTPEERRLLRDGTVLEVLAKAEVRSDPRQFVQHLQELAGKVREESHAARDCR